MKGVPVPILRELTVPLPFLPDSQAHLNLNEHLKAAEVIFSRFIKTVLPLHSSVKQEYGKERSVAFSLFKSLLGFLLVLG